MIAEITDQDLLRRYARDRDEAAFAELVARHLRLVVGTAFRILNDSSLAQDAAQAAFVTLARDASSLTRHETIAGWLHQTAVNRARVLGRSEWRRREREELAAQLNASMKADDSLLSDLVPILDDVLLELREVDRKVLLLRFFESKSFQQVGTALGIQEDAAKKRVSRALGALTEGFHRRGFAVATASVTVLALEKAAATVPVLPVGFASAVAHAASLTCAGSATSGSALLLTKLMALTKTHTAVLCALIVAAPTTFQWKQLRQAEASNRQITEDLTRLRADINDRERALNTLARRIRRLQATESLPRAGRAREEAEAVPTWYPWDEQSDFVRLPRQYASHYRYAEFDTKMIAHRKTREQRQPVARDGAPSPALLDALGITEPVKAQVSEAIQGVCAEVQKLAAEHSYLTNREETGPRQSVTLRTEAAPTEGAALKQRLQGALVDLLGQERADLVMQEGTEVFHNDWSDFGASRRVVTAGRNPDGNTFADEQLFDGNGSYRAGRFDGGRGGLVPIPPQLQPYLDAWQQLAQTNSATQPQP